MKKYDFKYHAKTAGITIGEVAVVGGAMIVTKKFLDFSMLFKNKIAADPTYADKWFIKHQGGIKLVVGALAAAHVKNPWLKLALIGIAVEGFITETRVLTGEFFDKIGSPNNTAIDQELQELADNYERNKIEGQNPTDQYGSSVAGINPTNQYNSSVAGIVDLTDSIDMSTGQTVWQEWAA